MREQKQTVRCDSGGRTLKLDSISGRDFFDTTDWHPLHLTSVNRDTTQSWVLADKDDDSFRSSSLLITRRLCNSARLTKRHCAYHPESTSPEVLEHSPGLSQVPEHLPHRSILPSQALFYRLGLNRRLWTPAFTQHFATQAVSCTECSAFDYLSISTCGTSNSRLQ